MKVNLIVTRHPALVELLIERGIAAPGVQVLPHVEDPAVLRGKHVAGVLPLAYAAACASITTIDLALDASDRGKELSLA